MKAAPLLLYALAAGRECPGEIPEPVSLTDAAVARATAAAAWFRGAPPPRHWTLTASLARDLNQTLGAGAYKRVIEVVDRPELLVKTRVHAALHKQALDHRGERAVRAEVLYLEFARGRRGVPALYGGWIDQERVYYVVQRVGASLVRRGTRGAPSGRPSPLWLKRCQDAPVEAARALLECFRSFTDAGYHMEDLHGSQFKLNDAGEVFAIDAPESRPGAPVAATLDWALRRPKDAARRTHGPGAPGRNCSRDDDCVRTSDMERCALRDCIRGFEAGARETRGWCRRATCVGVDARTHVFDLATRTWALPLILQEGRFPSSAAKRRLEELIARMRSEAPEDRPSLVDALAALNAAPAS